MEAQNKALRRAATGAECMRSCAAVLSREE
jgi:hypothetical protein